ncbi:MAG TPA: lamin tail domain-containing protein [Candidatus Magasanikbacteria bacterium]|nr:lamin tail domain-containing protein [Candidatus Magasanikbacteria bacterium]
MKEQWRDIVLIVFVIALSIFLFSQNARSFSETIIITEICPSGCAATDHQWVEVYNKSTEPIDLRNWKFWEGSVNHGLILSPSSTVTSTILLPHAYAIIAQNDKVFLGDHPETTSTVFDSVWTTLNKTGEEIGIKKGGGTDDFIEKFVYAGVNNNSLERIGSTGDPGSALEWKEHPSASTPGIQNYWWVEQGEEGENNHIPQAQVSAPTTTVINEIVVFDASASSDQEGFVERYVWTIENIEYEGVNVEYIFTTTGTKQVLLTVYDTEGATSSVSRDIEVISEESKEVPHFQARILINEFLSDPNLPEKEWIELYNAEDEDVSLDGYTLYDGVGKIAIVTGTINSLDFRVIYLNSSKLNQSGDRVILNDSTGDVIDMVSYGEWDDGDIDDNAAAPGKAHSVARISDGEDGDLDHHDFSYTITPTPNFPNNITPKETASVPTNSGSSNSNTSNEIPNVSFLEGSVVINEFVSSPAEGTSEFIELYNTTGNTISLEGWVTQDGSLTKTNLSGTIVPKGFFIIEKPKGSLNNSGDLILLTDPTGKEIDRVVYGEWNGEDVSVSAPVKAQSAARVLEGAKDFSVTDVITKNNPNVISLKQPTDTKVITSTLVIGNFVTGTILLNEIFPNPSGVDDEKEFIELFNSGSSTIDLMGWKIGDSSKKYMIDEISILAGAYLSLYRSDTGISLNNSGSETVSLWSPNGLLADSVTYNKTVSNDESFSKFGKMWTWTPSSTSGFENTKIFDLSSTTSESGVDAVLSSEFAPTIVEILPNPLGIDTQNEYIELYNPYDVDISLTGLFLDDGEGGSKPFEFPVNTTLRSHEYRAWYSKETKLSLTNTSESARILDQEEMILEEIEYSGAKENKSYTLGNNVWFWTSELTPNVENPVAPAANAKETNKTKTTSVKPIIKTTLGQVRNFDVGVVASIQGTVLVPPGILSSQYMYVGDTKGIGIQVYSYKKDFPEVAVGDQVTLSGEIAEVSGEMRLKVASATDIYTSSSTLPIVPQKLEAVDVGELYEGGLIEIAGEVTGVKGSYVYLDDGTDEVKVYIRGGSGIDKKLFNEGSHALIAGIVQETKSGYHLSPRNVSDVKIEGVVKGDKIEAISEERHYSRNEIIRAIVLGLFGLAIVLGSKLYGAKIVEFFKSKLKK